MSQNLYTKFLVGLILLAACTTALASSTNRERRRVGSEESSHRPSGLHGAGSPSPKSSTNRNNAITTEPGRKVAHRLIGGHLRAQTKFDREESLWDDGILMSSAGNGKEAKNNRASDDDDDKKTLSQQVKEGKYGLIQNEIYKNRPKRPGIISYLGNPEVPKDTAKSLGGLDEDEIWLAENHMLVLRGGRFPGDETTQSNGDSTPAWPPIDDYKAPRRQVKIPSKPKVPPPFPVQLSDGGPIQIIGPNGTREIGNDTLDYNDSPFTKGLLPGDGPLFAIIANGSIVNPDFNVVKNFTEEGLPLGVNEGDTKKQDLPPLNRPPTFYHAIPPGAVFVPPPSNQSDYDDDDQSVYYPPPYSFQYQQDNTTAVPPGPLVPGIILPPPPDFFSALEEKKVTTKKYTKRPGGTTPVTRPRPTYLPPRKLTTKQYKTSTTSSVRSKSTTVLPIDAKVYVQPVYKNISSTSILNDVKSTPYLAMTTTTPDTATTVHSPEFYTVNSVAVNQVSEATTQEKSRAWPEIVTSKAIPISRYYPTTTPSSLEKPVEVTPASIKSIITTNAPGPVPSQASYYFYEESNGKALDKTSNPTALYFRTTTEAPYYKVKAQTRPAERQKQYYSVETVPSEQTAKDYSVKFIDSIVGNPHIIYSEPRTTEAPLKFENSVTRPQHQRMLADRAPVYYQRVPAQPVPEVQTYYTTPKPVNRYRQDPKPKAIYQYSFEAADYSKRVGNHKHPYKQHEQSTIYNDYQEVKTSRPAQYVFEENTPSPEKISVPIRPENVLYKQQQQPEDMPLKLQGEPFYPSSTPRGTIIDTTPNPQHAYFTHQDEKLLDDVTKEYFTIFGKKLPGKGIPSTTPLYGKSSSVTERPNYNVNSYVSNSYNSAETPIYKTPHVKVHYGDQAQRPYSLKDDTLVNYRRPLPPINPDSEFITKADQKSQQPYSLKGDTLVNYRQPLPVINPDSEFITIVDRKTGRPYTLINDILLNYRQSLPQRSGNEESMYTPINGSPEETDESYPLRPYSLEHDIDVNYRDPRPTINPDAEFIDPIPVQDSRLEKPKAYFSYRLPGDGGHFYFQTPQAVTQRSDRSGGSLYPKTRRSRLLRRRRRPGNA